MFKRKNRTNELSEYRKRKHGKSNLAKFGLDEGLGNGIKCSNCEKVFYKFSEVYVDWVGQKVPCCPYCNANFLETEMNKNEHT